jgi:hypothetical protein
MYVEISKVYLGSCVQLYNTHWLETHRNPPPLPLPLDHIRGRYWSAKKDDIVVKPLCFQKIPQVCL